MEKKDLKVYKINNIEEARELFKNHFEIPQNIMKATNGIINDVIKKREEAAIYYCNKFDNTSFKNIDDIIVTPEEIDEGYIWVKENHPILTKAISKSYGNILGFHKEQLKNEPTTWYFEPEKGKKLGQISSPIDRVCVYVPGGRYVYPSSVLMTVIPAQVAGVKEIAVCTPVKESGKINNFLLYIFKYLGISEIYKMGGAQAIALMAYGGKQIKMVSKIVGPGNIYVTAAKKIVFGKVGIDSLAGPSEIVVIADKTANPKFIASDLISQAEHDPNAKCMLITDDVDLAKDTIKDIFIQLDSIKNEFNDRFNSGMVSQCIKDNCKMIVCESMEMVCKVSDIIAPEHLEIMTKEPFKTLESVKNGGSIFLGNYTPVAVGDYMGGTNHVIPTGGNAVFSSPLGVYDFFKKSAVTFYDRIALEKEYKLIEEFADNENLLAHKNSVRKRFQEK